MPSARRKSTTGSAAQAGSSLGADVATDEAPASLEASGEASDGTRVAHLPLLPGTEADTRESAMERMRGIGTASRRNAAAVTVVCVLSIVAWFAGSNALVASAFAGSPWRIVAQGACWLLFVAVGGTGLFLFLRRANASLIESVQGALDGSLRYEDMFEHHPTPMWVYDSLTQQFLAVNDAALHRYGFSEAEFLGMTLRDIRPKEDMPLFLAHHTSTTSKGYGDAGIWRHKTKSGEVIYMHVSLNRTTYRGLAATLVMAREVTQEVQARQDLEALKNSLEERVRQRTAELESANLELEAFARSAAHDLRTPLNGILGFAQMLGFDLTPAEARQRQYVEQIDGSAKAMLALIDGLLAMSQVAQKALVLETVDLSALAERSVQQLRDAEPSRRIAIQVQPGLVAEGDPTLLSSLLGNLLSNAWKYTSKKPDSSVEFGAQALPDESLVYFVRDNGAGFPMERAERLFKPFQRLHSASDYQGHGVGLVTCQRVVQRHGGRIWPTSEVGVGTTIWFTLPGAAAAGPDSRGGAPTSS
jgi:PAS domain S-box-containing protein